jgi:glutamine---fructose-6-phosphate transaminase (isomerizing)
LSDRTTSDSKRSDGKGSNRIGPDGQEPSQQLSVPGAHSSAEILSQPQFWTECLKQLRQENIMPSIRVLFGDSNEWLFIGCGSSYYIALSAAAVWTAVTGMQARALPASEILLFPDLAMTASQKQTAVLISRSGSTSETVRAAELLKQRHVRTLAVSCTRGNPLEELASHALSLPDCGEQSTVMTRSFTGMLLSLHYLAAFCSQNRKLLECIDELPDLAAAPLHDTNSRIREFVESRDFEDYVCLGQGPFYGLACETALKITEMSTSYAQSFHTLEFRHGPKSIVSPETLILFLLSEQGYSAECDLLEEIKSLGGATIAIANQADRRARASSDLMIEFGFDLPELARIVPYVFAGQLVGLHTGLKKGFDPDNPRNLTRVVMLNQ